MNEYPLTDMEQRLKARYLSRPDIQDAVLTHQELSEYIAWLAQMELARWNGPLPYGNKNFDELTSRINRNPKDLKAISTLSSTFANQREERYLLAGHDIAIGRMFRYMPAHWHKSDRSHVVL